MMNKPPLVLRGSVWGGTDEERRSKRAGHSCLLNDAGYKCCLGVDLTNRHGVPEGACLSVAMPEDVDGYSVPSYMLDEVDSEILWAIQGLGFRTRTRVFGDVAAIINDTCDRSTLEKVAALRILYGSVGVDVSWRPDE